MTDTLPLADLKVDKRLRDVVDFSYLDSIADVGLIEPIVIERRSDGHDWIVAGAHRREWLLQHGHTLLYHGTTCDPQRPGFVRSEELPPAKRKEAEYMENLARKPMSWQEKCHSIAEIHQLRLHEAHLDGEYWGHQRTAELLGVGYSIYNVNYSLRISELIRAGDTELASCESFSKSIDLLLARKQSEAEAHAAKLQKAHSVPIRIETPKVNGELIAVPEPVVDLSSWLHHTDSLGFLSGLREEFDHIITDPPYGIDTDPMMNVEISRVAEEHTISENLKLLSDFIPLAYEALRDKSFLVMWCDQANWAFLQMLAERCGFSVCSWPLIWCKTHPCGNGQAQANFTKATEIAMVCRKGRATLRAAQSRNFWTGTFRPGEREKYSHPFVKPFDLWTWQYSAIVEPGQHVLEPFAGEGSSILAGLTYGARLTACELSEVHIPNLTTNIQNHFKSKLGPNCKFS